MENRPATIDDLDAVVGLARQHRRRLAEWCPVYFNPRQGADEAHTRWLAFLLGSDGHDTRVLVDDNGNVVGFCHLIAQSKRIWVDDLTIGDDSLWPHALLCLEAVPQPWVTCGAVADTGGSSALAAIRAEPVCTFFTVLLEPSEIAPIDPPEIKDFEPWPVDHIFAESPFQPAAPGALVAVDHDGGYAVGSASANPPIYDPGGPSCVVDTIRGADRGLLLLSIMQQAAARGDVQMIVTCGVRDGQLRESLLGAGFEPQVVMYAKR